MSKQQYKIPSLILETKNPSDNNDANTTHTNATQKYSTELNHQLLRPAFKTRNPSELKNRLEGIYSIMKPFMEKVSRVGRDLRERNIEWNIVNKTSITVDAYEEQYFQKLTHPNVRTIFVKVQRDEIFNYMFHDTFNYYSTNCPQMEAQFVDSNNNRAEFYYGTKCVSLKNSIIPVPFHHNAFRLGLPEKYQF